MDTGVAERQSNGKIEVWLDHGKLQVPFPAGDVIHLRFSWKGYEKQGHWLYTLKASTWIFGNRRTLVHKAQWINEDGTKGRSRVLLRRVNGRVIYIG